MILDLEKIEKHCKHHPRVREWIHEVLLFDQVDSTNRIALEMASNGIPGGVVILAESQEKGRGRLGRKWFSPKEVNLHLSLLLRPHQQAREFPLFSLATSVALVHAVQAVTRLTAEIKWPNDILLNGKKVSGILLESETSGGQTPPLIIGIGMNVNLDLTDFPRELQETATSLKIALGRQVDRNDLVNAILSAIAEQYLLLESGQKDLLIKEMKRYCQTLGRKIRVNTPRQQFEGWAENIQEDGSLLVRLGDGSRRKILIGDITHLREMEEPNSDHSPISPHPAGWDGNLESKR